ncbi:trypsin-like serine peptidase [Streptomyces sp. NPDC002073]|uniref:trypsin-like serine peptidase n=1 Tax=Streptomyces sp. NBC_00239 TaxID=2903640 RepID=UPI002E2B2342|nr:trypsin-like peptidase domain-containing protein [Streptomyces sp. NBC_00239]
MRILRKTLLTASAVLLAATGAGTAQAAAPHEAARAATPPPVAGATSAFNAVDNSTDAGAASTAYWTPERMRKAIPLDSVPSAARPGAASLDAEVVGRPFSVPPLQAAPAKAAGPAAVPYATVNASAAAGKVFFKDPKDGRNYVCSASALNSSSRQLVVTAGHCVHGGRGGKWMTNWVYAPKYSNGRAPYGVFAAKQFRTFNSWITSSSFARDVAMVTTWPLNGRKLGNVTGSHGISVNYDRTQAVYVLGYPSNRYQGEVQMYCNGGTSAERGSKRLQIRCRFGPGSSGGPWLRKYNTRTGLGYVNTVMSTWNPSTGWNQAPYFDEYVTKLYKAQGPVT